MRADTFLSNADPAYLEALYQRYREAPDELDPSWRHFFAGYALGRSEAGSDGDRRPATDAAKELAVSKLIHGYRSRAHLLSDTNPIRPRRDFKPALELAD